MKVGQTLGIRTILGPYLDHIRSRFGHMLDPSWLWAKQIQKHHSMIFNIIWWGRSGSFSQQIRTQFEPRLAASNAHSKTTFSDLTLFFEAVPGHIWTIFGWSIHDPHGHHGRAQSAGRRNMVFWGCCDNIKKARSVRMICFLAVSRRDLCYAPENEEFLSCNIRSIFGAFLKLLPLP